jgi:hypothetical protein
MNLINAINKLTIQKERIEAALTVLHEMNETPETAKKIVKSIKKKSPYTKKNPHWMQLPENRARVVKLAKARAAKRK